MTAGSFLTLLASLAMLGFFLGLPLGIWLLGRLLR